MNHPSLLTIDVAHPPMRPDRVEETLARAIQSSRQGPPPCVLKIIHGRGSSGRGGATRETVRNWLFRRRRDLRAVIEGERFMSVDPDVRTLLLEADLSGDPDLNGANGGITIVWVR